MADIRIQANVTLVIHGGGSSITVKPFADDGYICIQQDDDTIVFAEQELDDAIALLQRYKDANK